MEKIYVLSNQNPTDWKAPFKSFLPMVIILGAIALFGYLWKKRQANLGKKKDEPVKDMARDVAGISSYVEDRTSSGTIQTYRDAVTDTLTEYTISYPAQSASIINDGIYDIYVWVNRLDMPSHIVRSGEVFNLNFETHKIDYLYFQCGSGESSDVRVVLNE